MCVCCNIWRCVYLACHAQVKNWLFTFSPDFFFYLFSWRHVTLSRFRVSVPVGDLLWPRSLHPWRPESFSGSLSKENKLEEIVWFLYGIGKNGPMILFIFFIFLFVIADIVVFNVVVFICFTFFLKLVLHLFLNVIFNFISKNKVTFINF